jgi:hypothetical protein
MATTGLAEVLRHAQSPSPRVSGGSTPGSHPVVPELVPGPLDSPADDAPALDSPGDPVDEELPPDDVPLELDSPPPVVPELEPELELPPAASTVNDT